MQPPPAMTDARGHFELTNLPPGRYQVVAEAQAGKLRGGAADVTTDAQISIRLANVGSLRGTVHGPRGPTDLFFVQLSGFPSVGHRKLLHRRSVRSSLGSIRATTRSRSHRPTERARRRCESRRMKPRPSTSCWWRMGRLPAGVVDKAGKPVSGMGVALIPDQPPGQLSIELREPPPSSGPDGRFQVQGPPGARTLVILGRKPTAKRGLSLRPARQSMSVT